MVKAQVLWGRRGKANAVLACATEEQAAEAIQSLLGRKLFGETVQQVLVEKKLDVAQEVYAAVTYVGASPTVIVSGRGGIDVEAASQETQQGVWTQPVNVLRGLQPAKAVELADRAGLDGGANVLLRLYRMFVDCDATLAEINPLVRTRDGQWIAADAKVEIDEDAMFRQSELEPAGAAGLGPHAHPAGATRVGERPQRHPRRRRPDVLRVGRRHHRAGLGRRHERRGPRLALHPGRQAGHLHRVQRQSHAGEGQGPDEDRAPAPRPDPRHLGRGRPGQLHRHLRDADRRDHGRHPRDAPASTRPFRSSSAGPAPATKRPSPSSTRFRPRRAITSFSAAWPPPWPTPPAWSSIKPRNTGKTTNVLPTAPRAETASCGA